MSVTPLRREQSFRSPEEIREQLEARFEEMRRAAEHPSAVSPCATCRWMYGNHWCRQPLVWGMRVNRYGEYYSSEREQPHAIPLCGPEKALWEPKLPWYLKLWNWFIAPWSAANG